MNSDGRRIADVVERFGSGGRNYGDEHIPAPSGHAPRLETKLSNGWVGVIVIESETDIDDGRWVHCENPVEVVR